MFAPIPRPPPVTSATWPASSATYFGFGPCPFPGADAGGGGGAAGGAAGAAAGVGGTVAGGGGGGVDCGFALTDS